MDDKADREKKMLVVTVESEECLRDTMGKLYTDERAEYDNLVEKYPGAEGIIDTMDPRQSEATILGELKNM